MRWVGWVARDSAVAEVGSSVPGTFSFSLFLNERNFLSLIDDSSDVVWVSSVGNVTSLTGLPCGWLFSDGFETEDTSRWSSSLP